MGNDPAGGSGGARPAGPGLDRDTLVGVILDQQRAVLGNPRLAATDDFFTSGGDSVLAVDVIDRLGTALGVDVPVGYLFTCPTAEELAELVHADLLAGDRARC